MLIIVFICFFLIAEGIAKGKDIFDCLLNNITIFVTFFCNIGGVFSSLFPSFYPKKLQIVGFRRIFAPRFLHKSLNEESKDPNYYCVK